MSTNDTGKAKSKAKGRYGSIGQETYDAVTRLIGSGMTATAAFAKVAQETGRSKNTVQTTYYRIARKKPNGGGVRKTARSASAAARSTARSTTRGARKAATGSTDKLVGDAKAALDALHKHVARLEAELAEMTERSREIDRVKKALHRL